MRRIVVSIPLALILVVGCGGSDGADETTTNRASQKSAPASSVTAEPEEGRGDLIPDEDPTEEEVSAPSGPTTEMVLMSDPVNNAFTVEVPVGWDNLVYSTVDGQVHHEVVNSMSPDGETVIFVGDPRIPSYWNPDTANEITRLFAEQLESMELAYYTPAADYFAQYASDKFGQLADFAVTGSERDVEMEQGLSNAFASRGMQVPQVDAVVLRFSYTDDAGGKTHTLIKGTTMGSGDFWSADVRGIATTGNPDDYLGMLEAIWNSKKTNPEFTALQNQRHQQTMAEIQANTEAMTRRHEANMAQIQASANAHQQRMQAMWSANDAGVASFYERMNSGDVQHRSFLNYINEENTVQSSSGQKFQVDNSYQRYWMNKDDNSYVGGDVNFDDSALRAMGLNPGDYEEVNVVKG